MTDLLNKNWCLYVVGGVCLVAAQLLPAYANALNVAGTLFVTASGISAGSATVAALKK